MVLLCLSLVNCAAKVVGFDNESRMVQVQAHDIPKANKAAEDFCHGPVKLLRLGQSFVGQDVHVIGRYGSIRDVKKNVYTFKCLEQSQLAGDRGN